MADESAPRLPLLGDRVIIPPAQTVADAAERPQKYECCDWWFCHKELET